MRQNGLMGSGTDVRIAIFGSGLGGYVAALRA